MKTRVFVGALLALALLAPMQAEAKTRKGGASRSSSAGDLPTTGEGPLGAFVAAPDHQVFANLAGFLYGMPTLGYEQALGADNSFTAQLGYRSWGATNFNLSIVSLMGSYRWYLGEHDKMQGFYAGPLAAVQMVNVSYDIYDITLTKKNYSAGTTVFGVGAEGGYQWILPAHVTFSVGLNALLAFGGLSLNSGAPSVPFGGFGAGLNGSVGYAF